MRHSGIYEFQELLLCFYFIVQDLVGNIDDLYKNLVQLQSLCRFDDAHFDLYILKICIVTVLKQPYFKNIIMQTSWFSHKKWS